MSCGLLATITGLASHVHHDDMSDGLIEPPGSRSIGPQHLVMQLSGNTSSSLRRYCHVVCAFVEDETIH